jgi:hypothetical protein
MRCDITVTARSDAQGSSAPCCVSVRKAALRRVDVQTSA